MNKNIFILLLAAFLVVGCSDSLNIEPEQSLSTDAAFSDKNTSLASLNGVYSRCQDFDVFGSVPQTISDYQSDNVNFIGSFPTFQDIFNYVTRADNGSIRNVFRDHFRAILAANAVIKNVPNVDDATFSEAQKNAAVAEAKYLRAILNFNLVRLFGHQYAKDNGASLGIALVTEPYILTGATDVDLARKTVGEVYNAIESDLLSAYETLGFSSNKYVASKGAAAGMLSRLYLYKGDNVNAVKYADIVLGDENYKLADNYGFYDQNGLEQVFSISNTATDNGATGGGGWGKYYNPANKPGARGDCPFSESLLGAFDQTNDKRFTELTQTGPDGGIFTTKFPDSQNGNDDAPVQRVTEIYLNKAEALAKQNGVDADAIAIVNTLRVRAGLSEVSASDFADGAALVDAILSERRKELCFEGHRRSDLLRNGKLLRVDNPESGPSGEKVVLPIPQREIDLGSNTPQNAGY